MERSVRGTKTKVLEERSVHRRRNQGVVCAEGTRNRGRQSGRTRRVERKGTSMSIQSGDVDRVGRVVPLEGSTVNDSRLSQALMDNEVKEW